MNKQIADDIKSNEKKINAIDKAIEFTESDRLFMEILSDKRYLESQKFALEAANEVLEYYQSKLGKREQLETGRHLSVHIGSTTINHLIGFDVILDDNTVSELYNNVCSSYYDLYLFFDSHFYELSKHILNFDLGIVNQFFKEFGYKKGFEEKTLLYSKSEFDTDVKVAKTYIDRVFELFDDKELMDRVEDALDAYLKSVFDSH